MTGEALDRHYRASIVVCAWCGAHGRGHAVAREAGSLDWEPVSHEFAQAAKRAGFASHGLCPACRRVLVRQWDLEGPGSRDEEHARLVGRLGDVEPPSNRT